MSKLFINLDANESIYFERELEHLKEEIIKDDLPEFKGTRLIPTTNEAGPIAETITYRQYTSYGLAKILANYSDNLPKVGIGFTERTSRVRPIGNSYDYSVQDIRRSMGLKKKLNQLQAMEAREQHERLWDKLVWNGDPDFNLQGFLYDANTTKTAPTTGVGGNTWALKTPLEIIADLNLLVRTPTSLTNGVEIVTDILMDIDKLGIIQTTKLEAGTDTTILDFFKKTNPTVKNIEFVQQLKDVSPIPSSGLVGPVDCLVGYNRNPRKLQFNLPQSFEQFEPQPRGLVFEVPCHSRAGSVVIYKPLSVIIMEGI